jgi:outer membrane protein assembly factor BamE (lipoprotein component of BamABCDE complex)
MTHKTPFFAAFPCRAAALAALLALAACGPKIDNRGYVSNLAFQEQVKPGQTTKDEVLANFGSPSAQSSFGEESWYYISARKETTAFLKPELAQQQVVRIHFDANGVVSKLEQFSEKDSEEFTLAKRITPTEGHSLGFFEQIIGNIGRFNKGGDSGVAPGRRPAGY